MISKSRIHYSILAKTVAHWPQCDVGETSWNFNIEKLQIILLFKGDFNQNNKWLGRVVMFHAEEKQQMAKEQYGSCKEKLADIQCLNKWLLYNYARYTHKPMALCSNNAKSCYDWIVLIIAALCLC